MATVSHSEDELSLNPHPLMPSQVRGGDLDQGPLLAAGCWKAPGFNPWSSTSCGIGNSAAAIVTLWVTWDSSACGSSVSTGPTWRGSTHHAPYTEDEDATVLFGHLSQVITLFQHLIFLLIAMEPWERLSSSWVRRYLWDPSKFGLPQVSISLNIYAHKRMHWFSLIRYKSMPCNLLKRLRLKKN
jgi:hypothetical protein